MIACQAVLTHFTPRPAANDCAPLVLDDVPDVVAHSVALDVEGRIPFFGPWVARSIPGLRDDAFFSGLEPQWACGGMDAPRDFPSGSHRASVGGMYADGYVCRYWL